MIQDSDVQKRQGSYHVGHIIQDITTTSTSNLESRQSKVELNMITGQSLIQKVKTCLCDTPMYLRSWLSHLLTSVSTPSSSVQFSHSVVSDALQTQQSFATAAHQAFLSITNSQSLLRLMSIESVMPSNHLILHCPLLLLPLNFPSIRVFSNESVLHIRWQVSQSSPK